MPGLPPPATAQARRTRYLCRPRRHCPAAIPYENLPRKAAAATCSEIGRRRRDRLRHSEGTRVVPVKQAVVYMKAASCTCTTPRLTKWAVSMCSRAVRASKSFVAPIWRRAPASTS